MLNLRIENRKNIYVNQHICMFTYLHISELFQEMHKSFYSIFMRLARPHGLCQMRAPIGPWFYRSLVALDFVLN